MNTNVIHHADCFEHLQELPENSIHACVTDPPYGLAFMSRSWDDFEPKEYQEWCEEWAKQVKRVLKPGGHLLAFSGNRTHHRLFTGVEDAGFEIRDTVTWHYGCLSEDTEILTVDGWKGIDEISDSDTVFSYDYQHRTRSHRDGQVVGNIVRRVFRYEHDGPMVHLENDNTDQLLTPNHKVLCQSKSREMVDGERQFYDANTDWRYIDAGLITSGDRLTLPLGAKYDGDKDVGSKLFAELLGWVIAEGWYQENAVNISQTDNGDDSRIRYILNRLGINHSEYEKEREYNGQEYTEYQWYLNGETATRIQELLPGEKPTWELLHLPLEQKKALFDGLMKGDGSGMHFYQNDPYILEWFQTLCHLIGKQARIDENKMAVSVHNNATTELQGKHLKGRETEYSGRVWCIQTDVGNFFARRNGQIFITGNSGFPKAADVSKVIDKRAGVEREVIGEKEYAGGHVQNSNEPEMFGNTNPDRDRVETEPATYAAKKWDGWKTGLKPATEFVVMARKPFDGATVDCVLEHETGALNIDGCRIEGDVDTTRPDGPNNPEIYGPQTNDNRGSKTGGRYPSNVVFDESEAARLDRKVGETAGQGIGGQKENGGEDINNDIYGDGYIRSEVGHDDFGGPSRYFYTSKATKAERTLDGRIDCPHPTVKPLDLCEWLVKLVTREGQIVLDPFTGTGTICKACKNLNREFIGIEKLNEPDRPWADVARVKCGLTPANPAWVRPDENQSGLEEYADD